MHCSPTKSSADTSKLKKSAGDDLWEIFSASDFGYNALEQLGSEGLLSEEYSISLASASERANFPEHPSLAFWEMHVKAGFRPIQPYLFSVSGIYNVPLNHFNRSTISVLLAFYILVKSYGDPTADLVFSQFYLKRNDHFFYSQ